MEKERTSGEVERPEQAEPVLPTVNPALEKPAPPQSSIHPALYVVVWIAMSSSVIIFNKYILDEKKLNFRFPIFLTTWHLGFATICTQILARFTTVLDSRKKVPMNGRVYLRAIVPIGIFFSLSLICGNLTYLYLSVSFIQMIKATTPVAVLITSWVMGLSPPNMKTLGNVSFIVIGVIIASFGEIQFVMLGFLLQCAGIIFEAIRLTMVQRLLSSAEFKMDPLVSLYYFAPACTIMNGVVALLVEVPSMSWADFDRVGYFTLLLNAMVAFGLNVSVVFLIGRTSSLVLTLCGVLKDILLVMASMLIFRDPVAPLQFFGYSIALGGLVYYKLGADALKEYAGGAGRAWADYGVRHPALRKLIVFGGVLFVLFLLLGSFSSSLPVAGQEYVNTKYSSFFGNGGA
ncbi:hypothetical protein VTO58DRAFT_104053 [Aureobasidium pullulans]|uniref:TPT-domain-containing protein n=1 Tax=Aureobasidium pullulans TaxID=5580 RepID=A0A4S9KI33_AURPU|nr:hypothetical protein JADG_007759 [Aureobasidium pullulans]THY15372.1 TPT-domain-containing protein [Aureobasidium pullulans]